MKESFTTTTIIRSHSTNWNNVYLARDVEGEEGQRSGKRGQTRKGKQQVCHFKLGKSHVRAHPSTCHEKLEVKWRGEPSWEYAVLMLRGRGAFPHPRWLAGGQAVATTE